jgi:hypothetical protein
MFFDVTRLTSGQGDPLMGRVSGLRLARGSGVAITPDDKCVLGVQRGTAWVAVVDLDQGRVSGFDDRVLVGGISTAAEPMHAVMSGDGRHLFVTSLRPPEVMSGSPVCAGKEPEGAIQIVDFQRALSNPTTATVRFASPAGCVLNAITMSPDGARLSNTFAGVTVFPDTPLLHSGLVTFDAGLLAGDRRPVPIGRVPLPRGPVALLDDGDRIYVGFNGNPKLPQPGTSNIVVIDASKVSAGRAAILGTLPVAAGHLSFSADRRTLYGAVWGGQIAVIELTRAPVKPVQEHAGQGVTK